MGNVGPIELLVVLVIALIVFGPKKLPEIGRGVGSALREFKRASRDLMSQFDLDDRDPPRSYVPPAPVYPEPATSPYVDSVDPNGWDPPRALPEVAEAASDSDATDGGRIAPEGAIPTTAVVEPVAVGAAEATAPSSGSAPDTSSVSSNPSEAPSNTHPTA